MKVGNPVSHTSLGNEGRDFQGLLLLVLFVSGFCSLTYQVVWLREFRLLFGASTPAASAVLATFMGGLGLGGAILGRKVERSKRPAQFYGWVEFGIAATTLLTPLLLLLCRKAYIATGGSMVLGGIGSSLLQIVLTAVVIGLPCFLMGGTLPAALSYAQSDQDEKRVITSVFYGVNILGALCGAFLTNFVLLYLFGNLLTLIIAVVLNFLIAIVVIVIIAKNEDERETGENEQKEQQQALNAGRLENEGIPSRLVYAVAFLSGFVFFVVELVWYRVSIPLLGGSVYNFGLILAVVLGGMGSGGLIYALLLKYIKPTPTLVAAISLLMALFLILPFSCGDWFAYFTLALQSATLGFPFSDKVISWTLITMALVFPASLFAGMQFPALISLLGKGGHGVAHQIGNVYAWNTMGAILGSLLGGFVFIPMFSLVGTWRGIALLSLLLAGLMLLPMLKKREPAAQFGQLGQIVLLFGMALIAYIGLTSVGPQSYWLQKAIGFGRSEMPSNASKASQIDLFRLKRRQVVSAFDGREASIAIMDGGGLSLLTNGKSDGSALKDAGTQVMLPLIPALLHPGEVKRACVVGLGTGSSAGWLAAVPSVERLDVIELEPKLFDHIEPFSPVNRNCLKNPKVNPIVGDAREILLVKGESYDLIASEPSNPHRAGVANLYTQEFYRAVFDRLNSEGIFAQWLQAYEIDNETVSLIITTLASVFPRVEVYQSLQSDLIFVCSKNEKPWDLAKIRARVGEEPFKSALMYTWGIQSAEGLLCRSIGNNRMMQEIANSYGEINTDGHNRLEFSLARSIGKRKSSEESLPSDNIWILAIQHKWELPPLTGVLDRKRMRRAMVGTLMAVGRTPDRIFIDPESGWLTEEDFKLYHFLRSSKSQPEKFLEEWDFQPQNWLEIHMELRALAKAGDKRFEDRAEKIKGEWPIDFWALNLVYYDVIGDRSKVIEMSLKLLQTMHEKAWCRLASIELAFTHLGRVVSSGKGINDEQWGAMFELLESSFQISLAENARLSLLVEISRHLTPKQRLKAVEEFGESYPFNLVFLKFRKETFAELSDPRLTEAEAELEQCRKWQ